MKLFHEVKGNKLIVTLSGELDHHVAKSIRAELDELILRKSTKNLIFDMSQLQFMDSSGIGVILGRYKNIMRKGGKVAVVNVSDRIERIFSMSGLYKVISKYRNTSAALKHM
ncbi:MAG: anti-sigma F factor antagonist [Alkaliphilus sp.]